MILTAAVDSGYAFPVTGSPVAGFDSSNSTVAISRQRKHCGFFHALATQFMGGLGGEPQGSPVSVPGLSTRPVPAHPFDSEWRAVNQTARRTAMKDTIEIPRFKSIRKFRRWVIKNLERKSPGYQFPRSHLEQPYFTQPSTGKVTLHLSMLADTTHFVSPLFALLNQLRSEGNDISAAFDEAVAMRSVLQQANKTMEQLSSLALKGRFMSAPAAKSSGEQA